MISKIIPTLYMREIIYNAIAVDRITQYAYWPEAQATLTFDYNLWPSPQTVIDTNKDKVLEQNPGWE